MAEQVQAAELPSGTVVVDDLKGVAFYAEAEPGEPERWGKTSTGESDLTVDYMLRHGAQVVRVGDGQVSGELEHLRVEVAELRAALQGPVPEIADDARERLARHLYIEGCALDDLAAKRWDSGTVAANRVEDYRRAADRILAVITGQGD